MDWARLASDAGTYLQAHAQPGTVLKLTQLAANIGTAVAAFAAVRALRVVNLKTIETQWNDNFRKIYNEFWTDETISHARIMISYDQEYDKIKNTLLDMALSPHIIGDMTASLASKQSLKDRVAFEPRPHREFDEFEIKVTEQIDQFCAKCIQLVFTGEIPHLKREQRDFKILFLHFWSDAIDKRLELKLYIEKFWPSLASQISEQRESLPKQRPKQAAKTTGSSPPKLPTSAAPGASLQPDQTP